MKFNDALIDIIKLDFEVGNIPALMGDPGIGKSSVMEDIAYAMGTKCFTLQCNLLADKADLTGGRLVKNDDTGEYRMEFFPHEDIMAAIEYAEANPRETPILFLDEINRTTPDVTSASLGLSTARKIGKKRLPQNLRLAIAGNLKGNVNTLDEASLSRFSIYNIEPEAQTFFDKLGDELNPWIKKVLVASPGIIFERSAPTALAVDGSDDDEDNTATIADIFDDGDEMRQLTTPRTIHYLSNWLNKADPEKLQAYLSTPADIDGREISLLSEIIEAKVGNTVFATQLAAVIAEDLTSGGTQSGQRKIVVPFPNCFTELAAATTRDELKGIIAGLTDSEKSGSVLYALSDKADHSRLLAELVPATNAFEREHLQTLFEMMRAQQFASGNVDAFLDADGQMVESVRTILSTFL